MSDGDRSTWWPGRIGGLITMAYVVAWAVAIAVLGSDRRAYSTMVRLSGNVASRLFLGAVVFASVLHAVQGVGRLFVPGHSERWRALAWFMAFALGLPSAAVLLWPFFEGRF